MRMLAWLICLCGLLFPVSAAAESSLQQLIDRTPEYGMLQLENRVYPGNIVITKPITIIGQHSTEIRGDHSGNVISIRASDVHLENLRISGSSKSRSAAEEYAAVKVYRDRNELRNLEIRDTFHGVYLSKSHYNLIQAVTVHGEGNGEIAGQGNGLHIYYSNYNTLTNNKITGTRDGIFFDYANHNVARDNLISKTRYGLHYMYSDENEFYHNTFSYNTGGAAIMNSNRLILQENAFLCNQGARSFGLLLQMADHITVQKNIFLQNQRGVYADQSQQQTFIENQFFHNDVGVEVWASSKGLVFQGNIFERNIAPVLSLGGTTDTAWQGNAWGADQTDLDLDQDGIADQRVEVRSSLRLLLEQNEIAYLFLKSPALPLYEKLHEWLHSQTVMAVDAAPLIVRKAPHSPLWTGAGVCVGGVIILIWRRRRFR